MNNELIYIDTNVIMDFLLNRDSSAFRLLMKTLSCDYSIIISKVVIDELSYQNLAYEAQNLINLLESNDKLTIVMVTKDDMLYAKELLKKFTTHYNDALQKVIAAKYPIKYFVTKNVKDFSDFKDINVKRPDEL